MVIERLSVYVGNSTDPYENLAREEYLTFHTGPGECILYLWQNARTVVVGRNQNAWKECQIAQLREDGGHLARRLSGGGAVYHDLGNLNFTFCVRKQEADVRRQTSVICQAVSSFGLSAEQNGRNDVTVDGRKFSGNAFYDSRGFCYHHGTLLVDVDLTQMERYLRPSAAKLESKGVDSVRSRVVNLASLCPDITVASLKSAMAAAFSETYGLPAERFPQERFDEAEVRRLAERFGSWEWKYGQRISFTNTFGRRFPWGEAELALRVDRGRVEEALLATDSMEADWFDGVGERLRGCPYEAEALCARIAEELSGRGAPETVCRDVCGMIRAGFGGS